MNVMNGNQGMAIFGVPLVLEQFSKNSTIDYVGDLS